jgi:hypothetical protein
MEGPAATPMPESLPSSDSDASRSLVSDWMRWNDVALKTAALCTALRVDVQVRPHCSTSAPADGADPDSVG